jgi:hypothetical protein
VQELIALDMILSAAHQAADAGDTARAAELVDEARVVATRNVGILRDEIVDLGPYAFEELSYSTALENCMDIWKQRYGSIVDHERHLHRNGTRVVKFYLHLSRDEQRRRFLARIDDPDKNWKFSAADVAEHGRWKDYMRAYEECLEATSTARAPWYVVPADDKKNARLIVSRVLLETMDRLKMRYPAPDRAALRRLQEVRKTLL